MLRRIHRAKRPATEDSVDLVGRKRSRQRRALINTCPKVVLSRNSAPHYTR